HQPLQLNPPTTTLKPYTTLIRSNKRERANIIIEAAVMIMTTMINSNGLISLTSLKLILNGVTSNVTSVIMINDAKIINKLLRVNPVTYVFVNWLEKLGVTAPNLLYQ